MDKTQQFNPECVLLLRLSNGRIVSLHATTSGEAVNSEREALGVATQTRVAPFITKYEGLTEEDIDALKQYPIINIRVTPEMTNFDYEIKGKNSELLIRTTNLINSSIHK